MTLNHLWRNKSDAFQRRKQSDQRRRRRENEMLRSILLYGHSNRSRWTRSKVRARAKSVDHRTENTHSSFTSVRTKIFIICIHRGVFFLQTNSYDTSSFHHWTFGNSSRSISFSFAINYSSRCLCEGICTWRFRSNKTEFDHDSQSFCWYLGIRRTGTSFRIVHIRVEKCLLFVLGSEYRFSADVRGGNRNR